jgi:hypothetical protein
MNHQADPLALTRALASDPSIAVRCAMPSLVRAWCAAAGCEADAVVARVRAGSVPGMRKRDVPRVAAVLAAAVAATSVDPWMPAATPRRRQVLACVRALERAGSARRRWRGAAVAVAAVALVLGVHTAASRQASEPTASFSAGFTSCIELDRDVDAAFQLVVRGGAALYVDAALVVVDWTGLPGPRTRGARVALGAGRHRLRLDVYRSADESGAQVLASFDGRAPTALAVSPCAESLP